MTIKIGVHFPKKYALVTPYLEAFCEGMEKHNVKLEKSSFPKHITCDIAVCWNHRNHKLFNKQKESGAHYLVMERGFIGDRTKWTSIGYNGLNGRADFVVKDMPGDRFKKHFPELMKPWKKDGEYILLNAQCQGDASVTPYINFRKWAQQMVENLRERFPDKYVMFRPHPVEVQRDCACEMTGAKTSKGRTLQQDLDGAYAVVTFNSNSGVDSVMAGVPTYTIDQGAMAWPVTAHNIKDDPITPDRTQWANDLAYKQWTIEEIRNGIPWEYLKGKVGL